MNVKTWLWGLLCAVAVAQAVVPAPAQQTPTAPGWETQGLAAEKGGDYAGAAADFGKAAALDSSQASYVIEQARAEGEAGQYEDAVALLNGRLQAVTAAADRVPLQNALADLHSEWGRSLQKASRLDDAIGQFQAAYALDSAARPANAGDEKQDEGTCDEGLSRYSEAITCYQQALALHRRAQDADGEGQALGSLGEAYAHLSRFDKAVEYARQALPLLKQAGDSAGQSFADSVLGESYVGQGQYADATGAYTQALALQRQAGDHAAEGQTLYNLGAAYFNQGDYPKSVQSSEQALPLLRAATDFISEGQALNNLGAAYQALGQNDQAQIAYQRGLGLARMTQDRQGESLVLSNLMTISQEVQEPRLAIFYGKLAVNVYQSIRADIGALDPQTQKSYLHAVAQNYRTLAQLLIDAGRLTEAQQVLDLLKQEEYVNFVHRDAADLAAEAGQVDLTQTEAGWDARYRQAADAVTTLASQRESLQAQPGLTPADQTHLAALTTGLNAADGAFQTALGQITAEAAKPAAPDPVQIKQVARLRAELQALGPGTVVLYTLVTDDEYQVLLFTPDAQKAASCPITAADLLQKVKQFRTALQNPKSDPLPIAREMYRVLLGPLAADLKAAHATTLMWSLDGPLRYIPTSALNDGQHYLVEDYRNVVFTPGDTAHLDDAPDAKWTGLGMGVSKSLPGFPALPAVPTELNSIIEGTTGQGGVIPGDVRLNETFTADVLQSAEQKHYQVLHIASHFAFHPGSASDSYLLLGDGTHLTLDQIKSQPDMFAGVDLLTLSACDTAIGDIEEQDGGADGKEVECFAVLAQHEGAKAVLASLWHVADDSTRQVMDHFYRAREDQASNKAEALRQAQLLLLRGAIKPTDPAVLLLYPHANYEHPYYWAPFVLMGNWK